MGAIKTIIDNARRGLLDAETSFRGFHGSPAVFDEFDTSKVGTGQGQAAFGSGVNLTSDVGMARDFRDALVGQGGELGPIGEQLDAFAEIARQSRLDDTTFITEAGQVDAARFVRDTLKGFPQLQDALRKDRTLQKDFFGLLNPNADTAAAAARIPQPSPGSLLEVKVDTPPSSLLGFNEPISLQSPQVQKNVEGLLGPEALKKDPTGSAVMDRAEQMLAERTPISPMGFSREGAGLLNEAGIPGVRAQTQQGTDISVIFDEKLLSVVARLGVAGAAVTLGMAPADLAQAAQQQGIDLAKVAPPEDPLDQSGLLGAPGAAIAQPSFAPLPGGQQSLTSRPETVSQRIQRGIGGLLGGKVSDFDDAESLGLLAEAAVPPLGALAGVTEGVSLSSEGIGTDSALQAAGGGLLAAASLIPGAGLTTAAKAPVRAGIQFTKELVENNLRLHAGRLVKTAEKGIPYPGAPKNARTVIAAPPGSDLPDFAVGNITPDDWMQRTQKIMSPDEIADASQWYNRALGEFQKRTGGDQELSQKLMGAWLVSQQQKSPAQALTGVLFQFEQLQRGVPAHLVRGKGLPSANQASLAILTGKKIEAGVGQKISDFVDAAEGKQTRSIMGDNEAGGAPFVVDVHTARDTGLVDQTLLNHLDRLGYDVPKGLDMDFGAGGIKGPMYESRVLFGGDLTKSANANGFQGRSDWTPAELQAVGWMGLTKLYGADNTGGDIASAFNRNVRRISMEADPGVGSPFEAKFSGRLNTLSPELKKDVSFGLTQKAVDKAQERLGVSLGDTVHATGGWERFTNPSTVQQAVASKESAEQTANLIGLYLQQDEVWVNSTKALTQNPKGYAIDLIEEGTSKMRSDEGLLELWGKLTDKDTSGFIQGYQPIELADGSVGIRVLVDKGGKKTKTFLEEEFPAMFKEVGDDLSYKVNAQISEAEIVKVKNDWTKHPNGEGFLNNLGKDGGSDAASSGGKSFDSDRRELEEVFEQLLSDAEAQAPKGTRPPLSRGSDTPQTGLLNTPAPSSGGGGLLAAE